MLKRLSNRDFIKFNEKNLQLVFYTILSAPEFKIYNIKTEYEAEKGYIDMLITPAIQYQGKGYHSVMIEFKYIKKEDYEKNNELLNEKDFYIVKTTLNGKLYLRCTVINPLTEITHLKNLIENIKNIVKLK